MFSIFIMDGDATSGRDMVKNRNYELINLSFHNDIEGKADVIQIRPHNYLGISGINGLFNYYDRTDKEVVYLII